MNKYIHVKKKNCLANFLSLSFFLGIPELYKLCHLKLTTSYYKNLIISLMTFNLKPEILINTAKRNNSKVMFL